MSDVASENTLRLIAAVATCRRNGVQCLRTHHEKHQDGLCAMALSLICAAGWEVLPINCATAHDTLLDQSFKPLPV